MAEPRLYSGYGQQGVASPRSTDTGQAKERNGIGVGAGFHRAREQTDHEFVKIIALHQAYATRGVVLTSEELNPTGVVRKPLTLNARTTKSSVLHVPANRPPSPRKIERHRPCHHTTCSVLSICLQTRALLRQQRNKLEPKHYSAERC